MIISLYHRRAKDVVDSLCNEVVNTLFHYLTIMSKSRMRAVLMKLISIDHVFMIGMSHPQPRVQ